MSNKRKGSPSAEGDYDVGYGRPPSHSQFKPGQSGNPQGRPKGNLTLVALLRKALHDRVEVVQHGQTKRISKFELAVTQLVNRAVKGDARATHQILALAPLLDANVPAAQLQLDANERAVLASILGDKSDEA